MKEHDEKDDRRFGTLEGQQHRMAGQLDVLVDNQTALMGAMGLRQDREATHKPVALMKQSELFWKSMGAIGGLLVSYKILLAAAPFIIGALKAIAHVQ